MLSTLNQVVTQQTPDAGQSHFWYDRLGRLVISQNAKQKAAGETESDRLYSYTEYDYLGRITEVGEVKNAGSTAMADTLSRKPSSLQSWLTAAAANKRQITSTVYDLEYGGFTLNVPVIQRHLRNRVSYTSFTAGGNPAQYQQAMFYSYDPHGNVDALLQDYGNSSFSAGQNLMNMNGSRFKKLVYRYDLISGKVNHVAYQAHEADQFYHRYAYDAENRLTEAETSTDSVHWQKDARYTYYKHGPLARTVLGEDQVQGIDYAYTLQGWLKGTNSTALSPVHDMGEDGNGPYTPGQYTARDAMGFALHYYDNDYKAISTDVTPFPGLASYLGTAGRPLYNGNISSMAVHIGALPGALLYNYEYDRLNRITAMDMWKSFNPSGNDWSAITLSTDYKERVAYDPNGNILKYLRNTAGTTTAMDSMQYHYYAGTNRLSHIKDNAPAGIEYNDIEDQISNNYAYDAIGNLTSDSAEHISKIDWNVYGKITGITRSTPSAGSNTRQINYSYDAAGNRIGKKTAYFGTSEVSHTWYVRDASGNVMAVYTAKKDTASSAALADFALTLSEQHVYGSSRLGVQRRKQDMEATFSPGQVFNHTLGEKSYELGNHLGNVLTTISDRKKGVARTDSSSLISYYKADVQTAQDYYPFGMLMPGRSGYQTRGGWAQGNQTVNGTSLPEHLTLESRENDMPPEYKATREVVFTGEYISGTGDNFTAYIANESNTGAGSGEGNGQGVVSGYAYGFNGKMNDNDVKGEGNQYDFGERIYDPRTGRFLSVDPLRHNLSHLSPYSYSANSPLVIVDKDGELPIIPLLLKGAAGAVVSAAMQFSINMIIYQDAKKAYQEIDWGQVTLDGLSSAVPWNPPGGKWGKAGVAAAGTVSLNAFKGEYSQYKETEEVFSAVAVDFMVSYLVDVGATNAADKIGKYAVPKIANWLATKNITAKKIKSMTGIWTSKNNQFEADVANYIEGIKKDVIEDVGVMTKTAMPDGGTLTQEIDIVTKKANVEIKDGTSLKGKQIEQLIKKSKEEGKDAILFAPDLHRKTVMSLEKQFSGIKVVTDIKVLAKILTE